MSNITKKLTLAAVLALAVPSGAVAMKDGLMSEFQSRVGDHLGTTWSGQSELWVDPMGNDAEFSDATLRIGANEIVYTWAYKGSEKTGRLRWSEGTLHWQDSWHQPEGVALTLVHGHGSLVAAEYSYPAGTGPDWHWRIKLAERPDGTLVLQMTNIAPWGEEARAVRITVHKAE